MTDWVETSIRWPRGNLVLQKTCLLVSFNNQPQKETEESLCHCRNFGAWGSSSIPGTSYNFKSKLGLDWGPPSKLHNCMWVVLIGWEKRLTSTTLLNKTLEMLVNPWLLLTSKYLKALAPMRLLNKTIWNTYESLVTSILYTLNGSSSHETIK